MNNRAVAYSVLLALLSPLLAFIAMVKARKYEANRRFLFMVLIVIYGTTIPLSDQSDGYRHKKMVSEKYLDMSWEHFMDDTYRIVTLQISSSSTDLYKHIISYISGAVFGAPGVFFLLVSFVYALFFSRSMFKVFHNFDEAHKDFIFWVIVFLFLFTKSVEGILTVRTWTGMWILFYAVYMFHETRKKRYAVMLLIPPLIHFGYLVLALPAYVVTVTKSWPRLFGIIFVVSSFTNFIQPEKVASLASRFDLGEQKFNQYYQENQLTAEEKLEALNEKKVEKTWYKKLFVSGYFNWPTNLLIYTFLFFGVYPKLMNGIEKHFFSIGLLMLAGSNIFFFISAVSNRMNVIGLIFMLASVVMLMQRGDVFRNAMHSNKYFKLLVWLSCILILPKFVYHLSFFLSQLSAYFFLGPFIPWLYWGENISVMNVIKNFL